jgi:peptidoglycan/xylan/chitin deacetylase (PgdA/CDA1 family)
MELIFKGPSDRRLLAVTIDDAPLSGLDAPETGTAALLDLLATLQIPATFFCMGQRVKANPGIVARAVGEGHELGNHLFGEAWAIGLPRQAFLQQLEDTAHTISEALQAAGLPTPPLKWFRPSGGWPTPQMLGWAESQGYRTVLGSIWPLDGISIPLLSPEKRLELQAQCVERFAHPGGILVLHDTEDDNPYTRETLRIVVPKLKDAGYGFVTLSGLLG